MLVAVVGVGVGVGVGIEVVAEVVVVVAVGGGGGGGGVASRVIGMYTVDRRKRGSDGPSPSSFLLEPRDSDNCIGIGTEILGHRVRRGRTRRESDVNEHFNGQSRFTIYTYLVDLGG